MTWDGLEPDLRAAAETVCTQDELAVLRLYAHGLGYRAIAKTLDISRDTARNRLSAATRKIRRHLEQTPRQDPA